MRTKTAITLSPFFSQLAVTFSSLPPSRPPAFSSFISLFLRSFFPHSDLPSFTFSFLLFVFRFSNLFYSSPFHDFDLLFYPFILFRLLPLRFPSFSSLPTHSSSLPLFFIQHSLALFPSLIIFLFLLFSLSSSSNPNLPFSLLFSSSFYSSSPSLSSLSLFPHLLSSVDRPLR